MTDLERRVLAAVVAERRAWHRWEASMPGLPQAEKAWARAMRASDLLEELADELVAEKERK
jgi:hypothetical protein